MESKWSVWWEIKSRKKESATEKREREKRSTEQRTNESNELRQHVHDIRYNALWHILGCFYKELIFDILVQASVHLPAYTAQMRLHTCRAQAEFIRSQAMHRCAGSCEFYVRDIATNHHRRRKIYIPFFSTQLQSFMACSCWTLFLASSLLLSSHALGILMCSLQRPNQRVPKQI